MGGWWREPRTQFIEIKEKQKSDCSGFLGFSDLSDCEENGHLLHSLVRAEAYSADKSTSPARPTKHRKLDSHSSAEKPTIQRKHQHQKQAEQQEQAQRRYGLREVHAMSDAALYSGSALPWEQHL
jgi:hypothetical protein